MEDGRLEFQHKLNYDQNPSGFKAWFLHQNRAMANEKIFFGHWSSLNEVTYKNVFPLDHGCVWGDRLTAYNLTDKTYTSQQSLETS